MVGKKTLLIWSVFEQDSWQLTIGAQLDLFWQIIRCRTARRKFLTVRATTISDHVTTTSQR